ncbi:hypothetical protein G9464_03090 [Halostella sp. JP-L12]|uniref:hypothetical protein n=1 Tax=Halostella TaxID=1843185 RepID=UPI000EF80776|nr:MULTISPECIES: hypothetical protein [Halostella]NHN46583.1 hypothetical protein [Halostella sp. JP-L12]
MGLFERVGRQVEQFRQTAKETAAENARYQCRECGARFNAHEGQCPECGADEVTTAQPEE